MAKYYLLRCKECGEIDDIPCDGDNPMFCPDCRSVDCFEELLPKEELLKQFELIIGGKE